MTMTLSTTEIDPETRLKLAEEAAEQYMIAEHWDDDELMLDYSRASMMEAYLAGHHAGYALGVADK